MFHLIFALPGLYVLARFVWPLPWAPGGKIALAIARARGIAIPSLEPPLVRLGLLARVPTRPGASVQLGVRGDRCCWR